MIIPCEVSATNVLPVVRLVIAEKLYREYGIKQQEIAKALGITQSAVSRYVLGERGKQKMVARVIMENDELRMLVEKAAEMVAEKRSMDDVYPIICEICGKATDLLYPETRTFRVRKLFETD